MNALESMARTGGILRGVVMAVDQDLILVDIEGREPAACELLERGGAQELKLAEGDSVLVWMAQEEDHGVVLGRFGKPRRAAPAPDELVIEARKNLTIRCGEGSITLRGDGKILIKGKDLVSRAQRMNRVKGGAVAIN